MDIILFQHVNELRERRCDVDALFIFYSENPLVEHLLNDESQVIPCRAFLHLIQVHEHRNERRLTVGGHEGDDLILDDLYALLDFLADAHLSDLVDLLLIDRHTLFFKFLAHLFAELIPADLYERYQMGESDALAAVLGAGDLCHALGGDIAGSGEALRLLDHHIADDRSVLQHIFQIHQTAVVHVLGEVIGVVEMYDSLFVGIHDMLRQQKTFCNILADLSCHVISLDAVDCRILVGILLDDLLVVALQKT